MLDRLPGSLLRLALGCLRARDILASRLVCQKLRACQRAWDKLNAWEDPLLPVPVFVPGAVRSLHLSNFFAGASLHWVRSLPLLTGLKSLRVSSKNDILHNHAAELSRMVAFYQLNFGFCSNDHAFPEIPQDLLLFEAGCVKTLFLNLRDAASLRRLSHFGSLQVLKLRTTDVDALSGLHRLRVLDLNVQSSADALVMALPASLRELRSLCIHAHGLGQRALSRLACSATDLEDLTLRVYRPVDSNLDLAACRICTGSCNCVWI